MKKTIIIMTKSFKRQNYCIAGIDRATGEWIRLVSKDEASEGAVLREDAVYEDGSEVQVLDIVEVEVLRHVPTEAQSENYQYARGSRWKKVGVSTLQEVIDFRGVDDCGYDIFGNTANKIAPADVNGKSLALIKVDNPYIVVKTWEKKSVTFCFTYNSMRYSFYKVSDIPVHQEYSRRADGTYNDFGNSCYVVLSLTGVYQGDGNHYKMAAQLF